MVGFGGGDKYFRVAGFGGGNKYFRVARFGGAEDILQVLLVMTFYIFDCILQYFSTYATFIMF